MQNTSFRQKYKKDIILNVVFNILYALFSTLLMVSMIPTLNVIFGLNDKVTSAPVYTGIGDLKSFAENYLNYKVTELTTNSGFEFAILFVYFIYIWYIMIFNIF